MCRWLLASFLIENVSYNPKNTDYLLKQTVCTFLNLLLKKYFNFEKIDYYD